MTTRDLISAALGLIGVLGQGQVPDDGQASDALFLLNGLADAMNADRLCIGTRARQTATWTASASERTIGDGGQIATLARPLWVDAWAVIPVGSMIESSAIAPMSREAYHEIGNKAATADVFSALLYEPTPGVGTLTVYPVPTTAPTLVLYVPVALSSALALNDTLTLRPGYREYFLYSLAKRCCGPYKQKWTREQAEVLRSASIRVARSNTVIPSRQNDPALQRRGGFDIETGRSA